MALSSKQIELIRQGVDIVKIVGSYLKLDKKGPRFIGLCPFHQRKHHHFQSRKIKVSTIVLVAMRAGMFSIL